MRGGTMPEAPPLNVRSVGRYTITRELRRDAVSVAYQAIDPVLHREVILKTVQLPLPGESAGGREAEISALEQAFSRTAQAAGKLAHPHIVSVFEAGRLHQTGYIAIERVTGRRLHELIAGGWRPQFAHAASIAARVADAIDYAHQQAIAHGHLGPQHVILRESDGSPKIEGFGGWIDSGRAGNEALANTEALLPYFDDLPDELRMRDIRAVVVLLHMMLTARAPSESGPVPPIKLLRPDVPAALARLIDDTLNANNRSRIATAADLRDALTSFIWNERAAHIAPATIGIPLAPPPGDEASGRAPGAPRTASLAAAKPPAPGATGWLDRLGLRNVPIGAAVALVVAGLVAGVGLSELARSTRTPVAPEVTTETRRPLAAGLGVLQLDISPWGEVYIDGTAMGVSPPLTELQLPSGTHRLEIRHNDGRAATATVELAAGQTRRVQHRFDLHAAEQARTQHAAPGDRCGGIASGGLRDDAAAGASGPSQHHRAVPATG
jgi:eukaryotic-like serine/threonine-protein kinase